MARLTNKECQERLGKSRRTVQRYRKDGTLAARLRSMIAGKPYRKVRR